MTGEYDAKDVGRTPNSAEEPVVVKPESEDVPLR